MAPSVRSAKTDNAARPSMMPMPAEWEAHAATWLAWPHNRSDWPGKFAPVPWVYAEIVRHIVPGEIVHIVVNDAAHEKAARTVLASAHVPRENVVLHRWRTDRGWTRDSGAIIVRDKGGSQVALNWRFNAWAKYSDWRNDNKLARYMADFLGLECICPAESANGSQSATRTPLVLEGGAVEVNGCGTMMATEECLLSDEIQVRNPGVGREQLEAVFRHFLGIRKVIWLERGIVGDDTHGHIDDIARFVSPDTVLAAVEPNPSDPNHKPLQANLERLRASTDQNGRPLRVIELPMPSPVWFRKQRLPASYANFYISNAAVLVPAFNDPKDRIALNILADLFPDRATVGIYCGDLILGLGAIHCMTQQQPK